MRGASEHGSRGGLVLRRMHGSPVHRSARRADRLQVVSDGRLWLAVEAQEDPGFPIGIVVKIAPEGTATAADAASLAYKPLDPP